MFAKNSISGFGEIMNWWKKTTVYQVYPLSFMDSNNDGIGDLQGLISKLDYIRQTGFETIWISPFYVTPLRDFGYDIADYRSIDPRFGTMQDAQKLIDEVHKRDMKIVFDMVMNHTSSEHPWFVESASSRDNPKRNWYLWAKGRGKRPPNNWNSMIGHCGWNYDKATDEWYYASFLHFQPDLNYDNPEVKEEMFDTVRFWLERGVDGFRLDIFNCIYKDPSLRDNPPALTFVPTPDNPDGFFQHKKYTINNPKNYEFATQLRAVVDEFAPERFLLGEVSGSDDVVRGYLCDGKGLNLIFLFDTVKYRFTANFFKKIIQKNEASYPYPLVPVYVFGNHDQQRMIERIAGDQVRAKLLALFQLTVRGVPVVYNGDEIGMRDGRFGFKTAKDPLATGYRLIPKKLTDALDIYVNRDGCRTPMQWDATENAGFSSAKTTWLPVNGDYPHHNVTRGERDPFSLYSCYRALLSLRRHQSALQEGRLELLESGRDILAYRRIHEDSSLLVVINFSNEAKPFAGMKREQLVFSTSEETGNAFIGPLEGVVIKQ